MNISKYSSRQSWCHVSLTNIQSGFISSSLSRLWDVWNHLRRSSLRLFWELSPFDRCSDYALVWGSSSACFRTKRRAVINATATGTFDESQLSDGFLVWRKKQEGRGIIHESWKGYFMSDYSRWSKTAAISFRTTLEDVHSKRREENNMTRAERFDFNIHTCKYVGGTLNSNASSGEIINEIWHDMKYKVLTKTYQS